jgi:hypothetical protein
MRDLAIMWMETHYGPFDFAGAGRIVDVGGADGAELAPGLTRPEGGIAPGSVQQAGEDVDGHGEDDGTE